MVAAGGKWLQVVVDMADGDRWCQTVADSGRCWYKQVVAGGGKRLYMWQIVASGMCR